MRFIYILAGLLCFLAALLFTLPAEKALSWWGNDLEAEVNLYSPQGGIMSGQAESVSIDSLLLGETHWRLRLLSLFKGRLGYNLDTMLSEQEATAKVEFAVGGKTYLHDLHAIIGATELLSLIQLPLPIGGLLETDIQSLSIEGELLSHAEGQINIRNVEWRLMRPVLALGSYSATLSTQDEVITAILSDADDAPLDAKGSLTLDQQGNYKLDISLRTRSGADGRLGNLLKGLGRPDSQGWYRIKHQGQL